MKHPSKASVDRMGKLNNAVVDCLDRTTATPMEVVMVLRQVLARIERYFELSVKPELEV